MNVKETRLSNPFSLSNDGLIPRYNGADDHSIRITEDNLRLDKLKKDRR